MYSFCLFTSMELIHIANLKSLLIYPSKYNSSKMNTRSGKVDGGGVGVNPLKD